MRDRTERSQDVAERTVKDTLELALQASGCDRVEVRHKPRLLSDNGASYISSELAEWLDDNGRDCASTEARRP